jgi:hypothetical protein
MGDALLVLALRLAILYQMLSTSLSHTSDDAIRVLGCFETL